MLDAHSQRNPTLHCSTSVHLLLRVECTKLMTHITTDGVQIIILPKTRALNFDCNRHKKTHCGYADRNDLTETPCSCMRKKIRQTNVLSRLRRMYNCNDTRRSTEEEMNLIHPKEGSTAGLDTSNPQQCQTLTWCNYCIYKILKWCMIYYWKSL